LALRTNRDVRGILVTVAKCFYEELFDGHSLFEHDMFGFVCTSEASAIDEADYSVFSSL
jgi:hypothetical protein